MNSTQGHQPTKAKLDNLLERLTWEKPMTAEQRDTGQKIRASGFPQYILRRLLISIGLGVVGWGMIGIFGYGLDWHQLIKDLIKGATIGGLIGWSSGYRDWVHNEREYLHWPTLELNLNRENESINSTRA